MSLSVLISNYNYAQYLDASLTAIVSQSLQPKEIIIIDDASTDNSVEIIKNYQKKFPNITFYENPKNLGVIANANRAIDLATGKYIALCATDDEILPGFFEESIALLSLHPNAGMCVSKFSTFWDNNPEKLSTFSAYLAKKKCFLSPNEFTDKIKFRDVRIGGLTNIYRKDAILSCGKLDPQLRQMCDWFLIYSIAFRYGVCYIPKALTKMRLHEKSYSFQLAKNKELNKNTFISIHKILKNKDFHDINKKFISSGIIYQIGFSILPLLFSKEYKIYLNIPFIFHCFIATLKCLKHKITLYRTWFSIKILQHKRESF